MLKIRGYREEDLEGIKELDFMMWLCIQWNGTYHKEDAFVAVDDNNHVIGVAALYYDGTFYYIEENREDIPLYKMQFEIRIEEGCENQDQVRRELLGALKKRFKEYKEKYPDKRMAMRCWMENDDVESMKFYLGEGFSGSDIIWVMGFDLTGTIPQYEIPQGITISEENFSRLTVKDYQEADERGNDGVQNSEDEFRFRLQGDSTKVFTAKDGDKVVSANIVWGIGDGQSATENVFTVPEYRHRNIGRSTLSYALNYLKGNGQTLATLSCKGDNLPAINMYLSMGYELKYYLVEMHYTV